MAKKQQKSSTSFGEGIIRYGDTEVRVLFNNRALAEAEQQMGKSVIGVAQGFAQGHTGIVELAHLLRAGMEASRRASQNRGKAATLLKAYSVMDKAGFAAVAEVVMTAVADVLGYSPDPNE